MGQRKNVLGRAGTLFLCDVGAALGLQTGKNISRLHLNRSDFFFIILVYKTPWAVIKKKNSRKSSHNRGLNENNNVH